MSNARSARRKTCVGAALGLGVALVAVGPSACGPTPTQVYESRLQVAEKPDIHAVAAERLRELMHKLEFEQMPDPDQVLNSVQRRRQMDQAAAAATKMAESAKYIAPLAGDLGLKGEDKDLFEHLAHRMETHSQQLSASLNRRDFIAAYEESDQTRHTCESCHALFRPQGYVPAKPKAKT